LGRKGLWGVGVGCGFLGMRCEKAGVCSGGVCWDGVGEFLGLWVRGVSGGFHKNDNKLGWVHVGRAPNWCPDGSRTIRALENRDSPRARKPSTDRKNTRPHSEWEDNKSALPLQRSTPIKAKSIGGKERHNRQSEYGGHTTTQTCVVRPQGWVTGGDEMRTADKVRVHLASRSNSYREI